MSSLRPPPIRLVCLDFDGTIMVYDDPKPCFHPDVIEWLNALQMGGIQWCSNSGRDLPDQLGVLQESQHRGLEHMPLGLLCAESMAYVRQDGDYRPLEPWNTTAHHHLLRLHARVRERLRPYMDWIEQRFRPKGVYVGDHYTAFQVEEAKDHPRQLFRELEALLVGVPELMLTRNGPWVAVLQERLGKGNVLREFARVMEYRPHEILAVGDQFNDLNMLDGMAALHVACPGDAVAEVAELVRSRNGLVAQRGGPSGTVEILHHYLGRIS